MKGVCYGRVAIDVNPPIRVRAGVRVRVSSGLAFGAGLEDWGVGLAQG